MYEQHVRSSNKSKRWIIVLKKRAWLKSSIELCMRMLSQFTRSLPLSLSHSLSLVISTLGFFEFFCINEQCALSKTHTDTDTSLWNDVTNDEIALYVYYCTKTCGHVKLSFMCGKNTHLFGKHTPFSDSLALSVWLEPPHFFLRHQHPLICERDKSFCTRTVHIDGIPNLCPLILFGKKAIHSFANIYVVCACCKVCIHLISILKIYQKFSVKTYKQILRKFE